VIAYYLPTMLTTETVMLVSNPPSEDYVAINTEELSTLGFKKACLDGMPIQLTGEKPTKSNGLYLQLYQNTKQQKWLSKIDTGKLYVPIELIPGEPPKRMYRKINGKVYTMAFLNQKDFEHFDKEGKYRKYRLVHSDRTEHYIVNGVIL